MKQPRLHPLDKHTPRKMTENRETRDAECRRCMYVDRGLLFCYPSARFSVVAALPWWVLSHWLFPIAKVAFFPGRLVNFHCSATRSGAFKIKSSTGYLSFLTVQTAFEGGVDRLLRKNYGLWRDIYFPPLSPNFIFPERRNFCCHRDLLLLLVIRAIRKYWSSWMENVRKFRSEIWESSGGRTKNLLAINKLGEI